jgi:hypothetical protein
MAAAARLIFTGHFTALAKATSRRAPLGDTATGDLHGEFPLQRQKGRPPIEPLDAVERSSALGKVAEMKTKALPSPTKER